MIVPLSLSAILLSAVTLVHGAEVTAGKPACTLEVAPTNPFFTEFFKNKYGVLAALQQTIGCEDDPKHPINQGSPINKALEETCKQYQKDSKEIQMLSLMTLHLCDKFGFNPSDKWMNRHQLWSAACRFQHAKDAEALAKELVVSICHTEASSFGLQADTYQYIKDNQAAATEFFKSHLEKVEAAFKSFESLFDKDFLFIVKRNYSVYEIEDHLQTLYVKVSDDRIHEDYMYEYQRSRYLEFSSKCADAAAEHRVKLKQILAGIKWDTAESITQSDNKLNEFRGQFMCEMEKCLPRVAKAEPEPVPAAPPKPTESVEASTAAPVGSGQGSATKAKVDSDQVSVAKARADSGQAFIAAGAN